MQTCSNSVGGYENEALIDPSPSMDYEASDESDKPLTTKQIVIGILVAALLGFDC